MFAQMPPPAKYMSNNLSFKDQQKLAFPPKSEVAFTKKVCTSGINSRRGCNSSVVRCAGSETVRKEKFDDGYYIRRCIELARRGLGFTSPNPMVGCVIVKGGKIVGEGFHPKPGQPHAEVFALRDAGELAENATAYVSLEPCNHYGRTPPCTEALIKAKVANVVVGMVDPNPIVASTGIRKLQEAGIKVTVGVEEEMCKSLIEAYTHRMLTGRPFVTLRYSMSLDGHIVNQLGEEAMERGGYYSKLLQEYDVVILSSTSLVEKSSLPISNELEANQPHFVVLSKSPNSLTNVHGITSKLTVITNKDSISEPQTSREGLEILCLDKITLLDILHHLTFLGACSVLLDLRGDNSDFEGILKEGFGQNLFQKVMMEVLPVFGGGEDRLSEYLDMKVKMKSLTPRVSGNSVVLEGYF